MSGHILPPTRKIYSFSCGKQSQYVQRCFKKKNFKDNTAAQNSSGCPILVPFRVYGKGRTSIEQDASTCQCSNWNARVLQVLMLQTRWKTWCSLHRERSAFALFIQRSLRMSPWGRSGWSPAVQLRKFGSAEIDLLCIFQCRHLLIKNREATGAYKWHAFRHQHFCQSAGRLAVGPYN